jgi:hypothetical protein
MAGCPVPTQLVPTVGLLSSSVHHSRDLRPHGPRTPRQSLAKLLYSFFGRPRFRHPHRNFFTPPTLAFFKHCPVQLHDTLSTSQLLSSFNHGKLSSLSPSPVRGDSCRKTQCSNRNSDKFRRPEETRRLFMDELFIETSVNNMNNRQILLCLVMH